MSPFDYFWCVVLPFAYFALGRYYWRLLNKVPIPPKKSFLSIDPVGATFLTLLFIAGIWWYVWYGISYHSMFGAKAWVTGRAAQMVAGTVGLCVGLSGFRGTVKALERQDER